MSYWSIIAWALPMNSSMSELSYKEFWTTLVLFLEGDSM
jgi:hypothetical protein